ncbi:hypothetical protein [Actinoplanes sp. L3-i22]|uniref:hypothetical protein n=1 Tax=Actinoplanes sp. L3-i22 TaxID=2836373 RepID=UPI001C85D74B|nr:hypothetical protein [Actinoplanes sp. L3-i22]
MIKDEARGVFRRCLPVLLAFLLAVAGVTPVARPEPGRVVPAGEQHEARTEPASDSAADDQRAAIVVTDREQVLTAQHTVSVGVSRAPPVTAV